MYKHFIAVTSVYSEGLRIAWHYSEKDFNLDTLQEFYKKYRTKHGDTQLGIHRFSTNSSSWQSIIEKDLYFENIKPIKSIDQFIELSLADKDLSAKDVAKYILTVQPMTHLKLQKLLYFAYEEFLKKTGTKLFSDKIFAWDHGPVVQTVYTEYKKFGSKMIFQEVEDDKELISCEEKEINPSFMRILSSETGPVAIDVINTKIEEYLEKDAWYLVEKTHEAGTPWSKVYKDGLGKNKEIMDETIIVS